MRKVADFPRPPAIEQVGDEVRIILGGVCIASTTAAWRVLETTHPPAYYLPRDAFAEGVLSASSGASFCEWKGRASYVTLSAGGRREIDAGWTYPNPAPAYAVLRDHIAVYAGRMDACFVGADQVVPQPGGFYGGWITAEFVGPFKGGPGTQFW
jgi:uncharacterized protein (DUF427 family)